MHAYETWGVINSTPPLPLPLSSPSPSSGMLTKAWEAPKQACIAFSRNNFHQKQHQALFLFYWRDICCFSLVLQVLISQLFALLSASQPPSWLAEQQEASWMVSQPSNHPRPAGAQTHPGTRESLRPWVGQWETDQHLRGTFWHLPSLNIFKIPWGLKYLKAKFFYIKLTPILHTYTYPFLMNTEYLYETPENLKKIIIIITSCQDRL